MVVAERQAADGRARNKDEEYSPTGSPINYTTTLADIAGRHGNVVLEPEYPLTDAVDFMISQDRTAATVMEDGVLVGIFTENDILQAYVDGVEWDSQVGDWLRSGHARSPGFLLQVLTVPPSMPLVDAAMHLQVQSMGDFACHHLVVRDLESRPEGILSSLDIARALCSLASPWEVDHLVGGLTVAQVMRPRAAAATCAPTATLAQATAAMVEDHHNCVLVVDQDDRVVGMITPRDVMRAWAEHLAGSVKVAGWLRGLQTDLNMRSIRATAALSDAAGTMAKSSLHHLLVLAAGGSSVVGVVSSLDIAHAVAASADRP